MASSTHDPAPSVLHPERALLNPVWIAALALLVVNDHVLKGSGLLPGALTGKLSDFAGLLVAPALLAALLRVRDRERLAACHVAVGSVFAGIQLSAPLADGWSALMGLFGHPWLITRDPSDLLALPMLWLSWRALTPAMQRPLLAGLRQAAAACLGVFGLWATVATSDDGGDCCGDWGETDGGFEDVFGDLVINNANDHDLAIYVRPLRDAVEIDCAEVKKDPAAALPEHAFGEAVHWVLPGRTNLPISGRGGECGAVWVGGEGIPEQLLFWRAVEFSETNFPGQYFDLAELPVAGAAVVFEGEGLASWAGGERFLFSPPHSIPELPASCEPGSVDRIELDSGLPIQRPLELIALDYGPDGCFELELLDLLNQPATWTSYLCAPEHALPFVAGERIRFDPTNSVGVLTRLLDFDTLDVARDEQGRSVRETTILRGASSLASIEVVLEHDLQASPRVACAWQPDDHCANSEQVFDVRVAETAELVAAGDEPVMFEELDYVRGFTLVHGQKRAVSDADCGAELGLDLDAVITAGVPTP